MKRMIIIASVACLILTTVLVSVAEPTPETPNPSADPVGFLAEHKDGGAPNYYEEPVTASYNIDDYVGPDGYEYFGEFHGGVFWISSEHENLAPIEESRWYFDVLCDSCFDFNQRSFCRYFSVPEEEYRAAIAYRAEKFGTYGQYIVDNYPIGIYGTYDDFIRVFVRKEYRDSYRTEECIPSEDCIHTFTYHTITDELMDYVGNDRYLAFREKYYGTEDFNILKFIEEFSITKEEMEQILEESADLVDAYKVEYLYGTPEEQELYCVVRAAQTLNHPISEEQTEN